MPAAVSFSRRRVATRQEQGRACLIPSGASRIPPVSPQRAHWTCSEGIAAILVLGEPLLDEHAALARPLEVPLQVGEARVPPRARFLAMTVVRWPGVGDDLLDRHDTAALPLGKGQSDHEALERLSHARLERDLADDEPAPALELRDLAEDRGLGEAALVREPDGPVTPRAKAHERALAPPGQKLRNAGKRVERVERARVDRH